jgi:hypothetical protein
MALILILILTFTGVLTQDVNPATPAAKWKQIQLLRSTRADVEKLMGPAKYRGYSTWYKLEDGVLHIEYYPYTSCTQTGAALKVRQWTVVGITFEPNNTVKFADLNLDPKKFRKVKEISDVLDVINYVNDKEGVDYAFQVDELINIRYFPGKRYNHLRCKQSPEN